MALTHNLTRLMSLESCLEKQCRPRETASHCSTCMNPG